MAVRTTNTAAASWTTATHFTPNGVPGDGDNVVVATGHTLTIPDGTSAVCGTSPPGSPTTQTVMSQSAGGGSLPAGTYKAVYTVVDGSGRESTCDYSVEANNITLTAGNTLVVTLPALPAGGASYNIYLTNAGTGTTTERLYKTGATAGANNLTSASWTDGTTTYAAAAAPPTTTAAAVTIQGTGKLVVGTTTGASLTARGDILLAATSASRTSGFYQLTVNPGGTLEFDASQSAGATATKYVCGPTQSASPDARVKFNGAANAGDATGKIPTTTGGNHVTVRGNAGGGNGRFGNRGFNTRLGSVTATFTDFTRIGDASYDGFQPYQSSGTTEPDTFSLTDCTLTACGRIFHVTNPVNTAVTLLRRVKWAGTVATNPVSLSGFNGLSGTGVGEVSGCSFDKKPALANPKGWTLQGNYYHDEPGVSGGSNSVPAVNSGHFCRRSAASLAGGSGFIHIGSWVGCYTFNDDPTATNPHTLAASNTSGATNNVTDNVHEFNGTDGQGDFFNAQNDSPASVCTWNVKRNLILPNPNYPASGWQAASNLIGLIGTANNSYVVEHNTFPSTNTGDGIYCGDAVNPPTGWFASVKSNLGWDNQTGRGAFFTNTANGGTDNGNVVAPANADYNAGWHMLTAGGSGTAAGTMYLCAMSGSAPGAHDVLGQNPNFVDPTRRLRTWGQTLHGTDGTDAAALALLQADPTLVTELLAWVRAGFAPRNTALKNAGHDGVTIGAVEGAWGGPWPYHADNQALAGGFSTLGY